MCEVDLYKQEKKCKKKFCFINKLNRVYSLENDTWGQVPQQNLYPYDQNFWKLLGKIYLDCLTSVYF